MADVAKLRELLERCEKASGPDREIDAEFGLIVRLDGSGRNEGGGVIGDAAGSYLSPRVTASLDASIALVERMLPGWWWGVESWPYGVFRAHVTSASVGRHECPAKSPPLAVLSALLRAMISQAEGEVRHG